VIDRLAGPNQPVPGDEYGHLQGVTSIDGSPTLPGTIYLLHDTVELVYLGRDGCSDVDPAELRRTLADEPARLRSRAGKLAHLWVHAEQGVAYSSRDATVHFLEVFRPRTLEEYTTRIYREPGAFIR
jgi:hypothetical protein